MQITNYVLLTLSLLLTGLLFLGHRPLAPLSSPGVNANEAAVIFLFGMLIRWALLVIVIAMNTGLTASRRGWSTGWTLGAMVGLVVIHLALGFVNLAVWNYWVSVIYDKSPTQLWLCVAAYFGIPVLVILALAAWTAWI